MILIISSNNDIVTNDVIDWLVNFKAPFCRVNNTTKIIINNIIISENEIDFTLEICSLNSEVKLLRYRDIKSIWYRRGKINIWKELFSFDKISSEKNKEINFYLKREQIQIEQLIDFMLCKKLHINSFKDEQRTNKLLNLIIAKECGLCIPQTYISSKKNIVTKIFKEDPPLFITKALKFGNIEFENASIGAGTVEATFNSQDVSDTFFPSLFQEKINKKWEIRTFFLHEKFYSTAIFSQNNEKTAIDFRNYDCENPNRVVPFQLPIIIEKKLSILMTKLDLNSGSIDLVYTIDKKFVFLEVNPVGQFSQVSLPANYHLEKKIAKILAYEK